LVAIIPIAILYLKALQQQDYQQLLHQSQQQSIISSSSTATTSSADQTHKLNEYLRAGMDTLETLSASNKDLLALHNGAWAQETKDGMLVGQDKIIRAFAELMRNIAQMKTFIRPSMCKPYGKQSESLQKGCIFVDFIFRYFCAN
jgi:hypothetical protein